MAKAKVFSLDTYKKKSSLGASEYQIRVSEDVIVTLKNPLRIAEDKRERLFDIAENLGAKPEKAEGDDGWNEVGAEDEDKGMTMAQINEYARACREILALVGDENVSLLIDGIGEDLEVLFAVFQDYYEAVGLGEASLSEG